MTTRIIRTTQEEEAMHERFTKLAAQVKPVLFDDQCIRVLKSMKPAINYHRLMEKNKGGKHEKGYRQKRYIAEKDCIIWLEMYLKSKSQ